MMEKSHFWIPPVPFRQFRKSVVNSGIRMACVVDDRLFHGLRFEGEMFLLTPDNWQEVITYGGIDFLLIESIWVSACGGWFIDNPRQIPSGQDLKLVVQHARKKGIPTVFWMTRGYEFHEIYQDLLDHFDYLFSTDPKEVEMLQARGKNVDYLPPCIQPAVSNPFRSFDAQPTFELNVLYDGLADLEKENGKLGLLREIQKLGLSIIESRRHLPSSCLHDLSEFKGSVLGCTTRRGRILALTHAKSCITFQNTLSTCSEQQWMSLEAAGSGLPVLYQGTLSGNDVRKSVVMECGDLPLDLLIELVRFEKDPVFRERMGHLAWRQVHQDHTFSHRIRQICEKVGLDFLWEEYPEVSVIALAYNRDQAKRVRDIIKQQTYPHIETVVLLKTRIPGLPEGQKLPADTDNFRCIELTETLSDMACLHIGHNRAQGTCHFRMDCQDHYGPHYIADLMLYPRCTDTRVFAKPSVPLHDGNRVDEPFDSIITRCIISPECLEKERSRIDDHSVCGRSDLFRAPPHGAENVSPLLHGSFQEPVALTDRFNLAGRIQEFRRTRPETGDSREYIEDVMV